jgi:ABC-type glycerol-3-phosphate transport system substrate-binding protein
MTGVGASGALLAACAPQVVTQQVEVTREVEKAVEVEVTREVEKEVAKEVQVEVTAAPEATTLTVLWNNWGDLFNELMKKVGDNYTALNPNVTVDGLQPAVARKAADQYRRRHAAGYDVHEPAGKRESGE